ncbi:hypothetical protein NFI96_004866, partial [Prochilodus magdalenae]
MLTSLEAATKKALYVTCVKVGYHKTLSRVKESRWSGVLAPGSSPRGSWRSLYKPPIEKRTADLQWRIVHGAVATNRHLAHIDPSVSGDCVFCGGEETTEHLFLRCPRLRDMFSLLRTWCGGLGVRLTESILYSCRITEEGCAALASALKSNPSHLRELNLNANKPGESGVKLLSDLLKDPHCKLEKL